MKTVDRLNFPELYFYISEWIGTWHHEDIFRGCKSGDTDFISPPTSPLKSCIYISER